MILSMRLQGFSMRRARRSEGRREVRYPSCLSRRLRSSISRVTAALPARQFLLCDGEYQNAHGADLLTRPVTLFDMEVVSSLLLALPIEMQHELMRKSLTEQRKSETRESVLSNVSRRMPSSICDVEWARFCWRKLFCPHCDKSTLPLTRASFKMLEGSVYFSESHRPL